MIVKILVQKTYRSMKIKIVSFWLLNFYRCWNHLCRYIRWLFGLFFSSIFLFFSSVVFSHLFGLVSVFCFRLRRRFTIKFVLLIFSFFFWNLNRWWNTAKEWKCLGFSVLMKLFAIIERISYIDRFQRIFHIWKNRG